jgi:hypothetical protein
LDDRWVLAFNSDNVKPHHVSRICSISGAKKCRRADNFALLAIIDRELGFREVRGPPAADLDKHQATFVEHDQIDLAAAAPEISGHRAQPPVDQETKGLLFGVVA